MKEYCFSVSDKFNGAKTIDFLLNNNISKEIIQKVKFGYVYLNGLKLNNINERVKVGDNVKIVMPKDIPNPFIIPIKQPLKIVFEDDYFLAVIKDKGVLTHSSRSNSAVSLEQIVCGYFDKEPFTFRPINRLDRDTSGLVLIAKDMFSASMFSALMKSGEIKKTYSAVVKGKPKEKHFFIEKPIKRQSEGSMKRVCADDGERAKSECKFIKELCEDKSLMEITLHTGRTHQIRVHLSSIGLPLYADSLYGQKVENKTYSLCAKKLQFTHPFTKKEIILEI